MVQMAPGSPWSRGPRGEAPGVLATDDAPDAACGAGRARASLGRERGRGAARRTRRVRLVRGERRGVST